MARYHSGNEALGGKLDVTIGDLVEIEGRKHDVVSGQQGAWPWSWRSRRRSPRFMLNTRHVQ
jgi:hypothetical protein